MAMVCQYVGRTEGSGRAEEERALYEREEIGRVRTNKEAGVLVPHPHPHPQGNPR